MKKYIINPDVYGAMYHRSDMSTREIDGTRLVFFKKKLYIPEKIREKMMRYYLDTYPDDPKKQLSDHCIWPSLDKDWRSFKLEEDVKKYKAKMGA